MAPLVVLVACRGPEDVTLAVPPGAQSAIVVELDARNQLIAARLFDPDQGPLRMPLSEGAHYHVLSYGFAVAEHRLTVEANGSLRTEPDVGLELLAPRSWVVVEEPPPALASWPGPLAGLRFQQRPCPELDLEPVRGLLPEELIAFAAPWSDTQSLVGLDLPCPEGGACGAPSLALLGPRGRLTRLPFEFPVARRARAEVEINGIHLAAASADAVDVWLTRSSSTAEIVRVVRGPGGAPMLAERRLESLPSTPDQPFWGVTLVTGTATETWVLGDVGGRAAVFHRARGGPWRLMARSPDRGNAVWKYCTIGVSTQFVEPLGPGRALVGAADLPVSTFDVGDPVPMRPILDDQPQCRAAYARSDTLEALATTASVGNAERFYLRRAGTGFQAVEFGWRGGRGLAVGQDFVAFARMQEFLFLDLQGERSGRSPRACAGPMLANGVVSSLPVRDGWVVTSHSSARWVGSTISARP